MSPFLCVFMHTYAHINVLLISYMFFVVVAIIHINSILYLRKHIIHVAGGSIYIRIVATILCNNNMLN